MGLKIAIAQVNLLVGDVVKNTETIIDFSQKALEQQADVVIFPELTLTGYPPEDLLLRDELHLRIKVAFEQIAKTRLNIVMVIGYPRIENKKMYNSIAIIDKGQVVDTYDKISLPNYGVFDEKRYFEKGKEAVILNVKSHLLGMTICEDIWQETACQQAKDAGATLLININASPYYMGKGLERVNLVKDRAKTYQFPIIYANLVGGQDELVFDGGSFVCNQQGAVIQQCDYFKEQLCFVTFDDNLYSPPQKIKKPADELALLYQALVLGTRDYVHKNGFKGAVLGLSGGIDSALTLAIAVDALGDDQVEVVLMPSRYTADMSNSDAIKQANKLGVKYEQISIEPAFNTFLEMLSGVFADTAIDTTEENIQARCRGIILMAISNKTGKILLTTGNKSEMSVGYATLYGDMAGGFAPIKDLYKGKVYALARWCNRNQTVIPERVITRPPSAELAPDQKDSDSLPDYVILDDILERFVERDETMQQIIQAGYSEILVKKIISMVDRNEYKRRQSPPGVKVTTRAFGRDRRYPLSSGF